MTPYNEYFLKTRWGILKVGIGSDGLVCALFENCSQEKIKQDTHFYNTFLNWLQDFQNSTINDRWAALSPDGTDFQKSVWKALLEIPSGSKVSYSTIAKSIGRPNACRAIGSAVGANPIALLIPCHRVVPAAGGIGNYRWGSDRKQAILEIESACNGDLTQLFEAA